MSVRTETVIKVPNPQSLMDEFVHHIEEDHDAAFEVGPDGSRYLENVGFRVEFLPLPDGLKIAIKGPHQGMLVFVKDAVAQHVGAFDAELAKSMRWSGEAEAEGELPANFRILKVTAKSAPMSGLVRVTLHVPDSAFFAEAGIHLKMMLPASAGRPPVWPRIGANGAPVWPQGDDALHARFMTIRHARPDASEIDIDIAAHGDGLISNWAMNATEGQEIGALGPIGNVEIPNADSYLLAADLTGLPTIARFLEDATHSFAAQIVAEAASIEALREYLPATDAGLHHLETKEFSNSVLETAKAHAADGVSYAYFAGEFQDAQDLRKYFKATLGLGKGKQLSAPYWRRGTAGFEA